MRARGDFQAAVAVTAVGTGLGFASGRTQAVFCAQTVRASWLGAAFSALAYGLLMAMICHLKRRTGAQRLPGVYRRLLGCHAGKLIGGLYAAALVVAAVLLLSAAAKVGALVLPIRRAALVGALAALLIAGIAAALGDGALACMGGAYLALLILLELVLWRFGGRPDPARLQFVVDLRLADSVGGALALGALCACMSTALSAGVVVRMAGGRSSPSGVGLFCALLYLLVQLTGNAALQCQQREVLSLRTPFVALTALWGKPGFYFSALLIFLGAVNALTGVLRALMPGKVGRRDFYGC